MAAVSSSNEDILPQDEIDLAPQRDRWRRKDIHEETQDVMNSKSEFYESPRCRGVVEWINCSLFDALLLVLEAAINLWLATCLNAAKLTSEYRAIIVMLMLPSLINPILWLRLKSNYKLSSAFILVLLVVGFPSPLFLYLWHLYLSMFSSLRDAETSKMLSNTFRMVHSCITSMPLLVINIATLINQLRVDGLEDYVIDLQSIYTHAEKVDLHAHSIAFILSFVNFVRGACLFNERQTLTLLFGVVALPMTMITSLFRIILLAIVVAFVEPELTAILLIGLVSANAVLLFACRKGTKLIKGEVKTDLKGDGKHNPQPGSQQSLTSNCCTGGVSGRQQSYVLTNSPNDNHSCWSDMSKFILLGMASIITPSGYANDLKSHHPRIKGGLYLILNYLVNMTILGVSLGYTILHRVPNDIHGVVLPKMPINVVMPKSQITAKTGVMDLNFNLPESKIDLGSMPSMKVNLSTESSDRWIAILFPVALAVLCLPFTIMRAAMMELDCFVTRRKQLGEDFDDFLVTHGKKSVALHNRRHYPGVNLRDVLAENVESKELKCRLYTAFMCSGLGLFVMMLFQMLLGAFFYAHM